MINRCCFECGNWQSHNEDGCEESYCESTEKDCNRCLEIECEGFVPMPQTS